MAGRWALGGRPGRADPRVMAITLLAAGVEPGHYLDWGVVHISTTNLSIVIAMLVVFALALVVPLRRHAPDDEDGQR
jgi:hypothetical protein